MKYSRSWFVQSKMLLRRNIISRAYIAGRIANISDPTYGRMSFPYDPSSCINAPAAWQDQSTDTFLAGIGPVVESLIKAFGEVHLLGTDLHSGPRC
jgi:hypothetical protein